MLKISETPRIRFLFDFRAPSRSDSLLRDSTLPEFTRNTSHLSTNQRSPEPPKGEKSFRQPSRHSKSRSSHHTLTPRLETPKRGRSDDVEPSDVQSSATFDGRPSSRGLVLQGVRAVSRSGTGTTPRSQRASSRFGGATPRGEDSERPLSRAIGIFFPWDFFKVFFVLMTNSARKQSKLFTKVSISFYWYVHYKLCYNQKVFILLKKFPFLLKKFSIPSYTSTYVLV